MQSDTPDPSLPATPSADKKPSRLGRGLSSLMNHPVSVTPPASEASAESNNPTSGAEAALVETPALDVPRGTPGMVESPADPPELDLVWLDLAQVAPNPHQPRTQFDPDSLQDLAASIKAHGVMQPVVVRKRGTLNGKTAFELIAGERRWRAAKLADLPALPAVVRDLDDQTSAEWALVENLQREDLNPIERAEALEQLIQQFGLTHAEVGEKVGLKRSSVSNLLRLNELPADVRESLAHGRISMGHARAMLGLEKGGQDAIETVLRSAEDGFSVRDTETYVRYFNERIANRFGDYPRPPHEAASFDQAEDIEAFRKLYDTVWPHCQLLPETESQRLAESRGESLADPVESLDADPAKQASSSGGKPFNSTSAWIQELERQLATELTTKVSIKPAKKAGHGSVTIHYHSLDHFDDLLGKLGVKPE